MDIRICIPFSHDFDAAKSGLRDLKIKGKAKRKDVIEYDGYIFDIEPRHSGPDMAKMRNSFITDLKGKVPLNYDYWMFIDSDIIWKIEDLIALLKHEKDVICGPYLGRSVSTYCTGMWSINYGVAQKMFGPQERGLKIVDFTGAGFLLVSRAALLKLSYPYFRGVLYKDADGGMEQLSEDYGFCAMCREQNIRIWCDFDLNLQHKPREVTAKDFDF